MYMQGKQESKYMQGKQYSHKNSLQSLFSSWSQQLHDLRQEMPQSIKLSKIENDISK